MWWLGTGGFGMTLPVQLRAIADRIEAAELQHRLAVDELVGLATDRVSLMDGWPVEDAQPTAARPSARAGAKEAPARARSASPSAPIEQAAPDRSLTDGNAAAFRPGASSPAPPGRVSA
jgi:hypothetical protein